MPQRRITPYLTATLAALLVIVLGQTALASSPGYESDLIRRAEAQFGPQAGLQAGAEPAPPVKCGTPLVYEIRMAWPNLSPATRQFLASLAVNERPELDEQYDFDIRGHRFRIHYTRTGIDSVDMTLGVGEGDVPNYVLKCAAYMDTVVAREVDEMGFVYPVSDSIGKPGENARFDIYFTNLGSQYFGWTTPETITEQPGGVYIASSWLRLNSDFRRVIGYKDRPFDAMAVTVAHEFHHSIQWSYDAFEAEYREVAVQDTVKLVDFPWFFELTSTDMEEAVFDRINDYYTYLPAFYEHPEYSLRLYAAPNNAEGLHCYASCVWGRFLTQKYGESVMREIWEECATKSGFNTFEAFETVLNRHGASFEQAWAEFLVWNYFTGRRASSSWGYEEGLYYPEIIDTQIAYYDTYPVTDSVRQFSFPRPPDELAGAYMRFIPTNTDSVTDFNIELSTPSNFNGWMVVAAGLRGNVEPDIFYTTEDVLFHPVTVPNWDQYEEVMVIVSPFQQHVSQEVLNRSIDFNYAVQDSFGGGVETSAVRKVYSNPLISSTASSEPFRVEVALAGPAEVSMYIYTPSGQLIRGGPTDNDASNQMFWQADRRTVDLWWAGTNRDNQQVASGVYLALVKIGDQSEVIKVAVINK